MMVAYSTVVLYVLTLSPVLCQSKNADQTCTDPNVYIDKNGNCTVCPTTCPPGYGYFEHSCGYGKMTTDRCHRCVDGETYSVADNKNRCYPCNPCHNHEIIKNCTATANSECPACVHGYGWDQFRRVCKDCKYARRVLPGCEKPPEVIVTEHHVRRVICKNVPEQGQPDQVSWFLNDEILDTSDENKFVVIKGNELLILDPGIDDYGVYTCRAEWKANTEHNFDIMKMSSNKVETFPKEEYGENSSENTERELSTKKQCIDGNDRDTAKTVIHCRPCLLHWILWILICIVCLLLPNAWLYNKINCRSKCTTGYPSQLIVYHTQPPIPTQHIIPTAAVPLLSPEPQKTYFHNDVESAATLGHVQELETTNKTECTDDDVMVTQETEEKVTRNTEENVENIYQKAVACSSDLYYRELDVETIDWLTVLLNPHTNPDPPIKYWRHLASYLDTDQATINSLGTYRRFHDYLLPKEVSMQTFLEALWKVENHQATKVVCKAVIKIHENEKK